MKHLLDFNLRMICILVLTILGSTSTAGQDLMDLLETETEEPIEFTTATFKSTRVMNGHSIERMQAGQLDFRIHHRFGNINSGAYEFWGLDEANIHLSLEYGITDWLMVGVGRGTYEKTYDGLIQFSILRQSTGKRKMPLSLSAYATAGVNSLKWADPEQVNYFSSRLTYTYHLMIARKFSERLSLQITPTLVHRNLVETGLDPNDLYAMGIGGRFKLTKRVSFNMEYFYLHKPAHMTNRDSYYNALSVGFDVETGGHVFQLIVTNSQPMIEKGFITETNGNWLDGDIRFGFNISRVFALK